MTNHTVYVTARRQSLSATKGMNLIQLDSFLDSGDGRPFQSGLLARNAAQVGQACRKQSPESVVSKTVTVLHYKNEALCC